MIQPRQTSSDERKKHATKDNHQPVNTLCRDNLYHSELCNEAKKVAFEHVSTLACQLTLGELAFSPLNCCGHSYSVGQKFVGFICTNALSEYGDVT